MAVAALLLWLCTAAVGGYLLVTAAHSGNTVAEPEEAEPVTVPSDRAGSAQAGTPATSAFETRRPTRDDILFAPESLQRSRSETLPSLKDYAEFAHPALAMIGIGFWLGYVVSRDRLFAMIGLGILLGAICAGVSLFTVNTRAARRAAAAQAEAEPGEAAAGVAPLTAPPVVLILHAIGATLTLLFALLIAFHA
ncbi:MAG TPA: hypothetical protein VIZ43_09710 [Trebonia sp.]